MSCQIECQGNLSAKCQTDMKGGCEVACKSPEGALFCDGQYVDHGGNLKDCISALEAAMSITVDVSASASFSGECAGGSCSAQGEAEAGCGMTVANGTTDGSTPYALGLLGALGALVFGRYRRRQR
jgi:MYXO-CTERM domain-containing protein